MMGMEPSTLLAEVKRAILWATSLLGVLFWKDPSFIERALSFFAGCYDKISQVDKQCQNEGHKLLQNFV